MFSGPIHRRIGMGFDVDRYRAAFLTCFFLFTRARARDARKALSGKGWEKFQDRFNSAFFRVISAFFRVTLPFSGCYPQNSAKTEIRQNSCNLPKKHMWQRHPEVGRIGEENEFGA